MSDVKVKIVLDTCIIIHFIKGECLSILNKIYAQYDFVVLSILLEAELPHCHSFRKTLESHIHHLKTIKIVEWEPTTEEEYREYSLLEDCKDPKIGKGEIYCMVYCRFNHDAIASSNVKDIKDYCNKYNIIYITTEDLLYQAFVKGIMTEKECDDFISKVLNGGSQLGITRMADYKPRDILL